MRATVQDYLGRLQALLPSGPVWPRDEDAWLTKLLTALAAPFTRLHNRGVDVMEEADPRLATETLVEWEDDLGLPDACSAEAATTLQERRRVAHNKLTARGGQSPAYLVERAAALGFPVTITEYRPFRAGMSQAGDPLTNDGWVHTFRVNAPPVTIVEFRAGVSAADEPLAKWGNELLECGIKTRRPAHTNALFGYGD